MGGGKGKRLKQQSALELLTTYSWALLIIAIFVAAVAVINSARPATNYLASSCSIEPLLLCTQTLLNYNAISPIKFTILFQNNLGQTMYFPLNSINITVTNIGNKGVTYSKGNCTPSLALQGTPILCSAYIPGTFKPAIGTQETILFSLNYQLCRTNAPSSCASTQYRTAGQSSQTMAPSATVFHTLKITASPTSGFVNLNGVTYLNNANVLLLTNNYNVYAIPPSGYKFSSWGISVGAGGGTSSVVSSSTQNTILNLGSNATLTANFGTLPTTSTVTLTSTSTASTSSTTTSSTTTTTIFAATCGGSASSSSGNTICTFTSSGTFTPNGAGNVAVLVVAGGGGGGKSGFGGGGGGGVVYASSYAVSSVAYSVTVGGGGSGAYDNNGISSVFSTITAIGGGGASGQNGGSGGGCMGCSAGGTSIQGNSGGGTGYGNNGAGVLDESHSGGGGGAGSPGSAGSPGAGGAGGSGMAFSISGSVVYYAGGGGGIYGGAGGSGGGGNGVATNGNNGFPGTANTGGGGGAGGASGDNGGDGGSGIVIIAYNALGNGTP
ncbi:MAG: hypothetical protein KGH66_00095 [Candidatus Micrarchaeota archaeon]|nr:hypothetical protein [Candidatus Micrarchaeota archaeon]